MKFEKALRQCPELADHLKPGMQALKSADARCVTCDDTRQLAGSVDVDSALSHDLPNATRWDYAVGVERKRRADFVTWIEVHPASSTGEVKVVLNKLDWLKSWAEKHAPDLMKLDREFVWVATGRVAFSSGSKQRRLLAANGIKFSSCPYSIRTD
ncbi:MAG: hypothetical protein ACREEM_08955 [Blastocatellia bacterium]